MRKRNLAIIGAGGLLVAGSLTGVAVAASSGDDETPITGPELEQASAAALAHTGGGEVTETEANDEEGAYEVEVTLDDGTQVDVHLDSHFNVISSENDGHDDEDDEDGTDDDDD